MRVLLLTTRDIGQRATGRIVVLRTHAEALATLGHEVTVAVVSPNPPGESGWTRRFPTRHIRAPRMSAVALSALHALTFGNRSLNECLFVDRSVHRQVLGLFQELGVDLIVVDGVRLFPATAGIGAPVVVDLDDLLSLRYERLRRTARDDPVAVLGFAAAHVPPRLRPAVGRLGLRLLGWESRRIARRELQVCHAAAAVSLVSRSEVDQLRNRSGGDITWLPPAVPIPERPVEQEDGLAFLGGLDYLPNVHALRFYRDEVLPTLDPGDPGHVLHVIGHCPEALRSELDVPGIVLHGYVDDLHAALRRRLLVAPLRPGGGVKLKVLDGMAHGLPVVGTPSAFAGLGLPADLRLQADSGPALGELIRKLANDPAGCRDAGRHAREAVRRLFSPAAAARRWADLLSRLDRAA